jgi:lipopolysaccharide/colanic/teichoic acid biosynthesis glycosyltransferase
LEAALRERLARSRSYNPVKRALDIAISATLIALLSPLLLAIAVAIRVETRGPILFVQPRHGLRGRPFNIFKFRTMHSDRCDTAGTRQAIAGDPRVTAIGRYLRRYSLDELPQLWNVLKGDMSLVGPRAHPIGMMAGGKRYEELVPTYHLRHLVRPGVTGLAQVRGLRGPTHDPVPAKMRITSDLAYLGNRSFWLDMNILARTVVVGLRSARGF